MHVYRPYPRQQPATPGSAVFDQPLAPDEVTPPARWPIGAAYLRDEERVTQPRSTMIPEAPPQVQPPFRALVRVPAGLEEQRARLLPIWPAGFEDQVIVVCGDPTPPAAAHYRARPWDYRTIMVRMFQGQAPVVDQYVAPPPLAGLRRFEPERARQPTVPNLAQDLPDQVPRTNVAHWTRAENSPAVPRPAMAAVLEAPVAPPAYPFELLRELAGLRHRPDQVGGRVRMVWTPIEPPAPPTFVFRAPAPFLYARVSFEWPQRRPWLAAILAPEPPPPTEDVRIRFKAGRERTVFTTAREVSIFKAH